jgi:phospholipase/carboxylesterase
LQSRTSEELYQGVEAVRPLVNQYIDNKLSELSLSIDRLAVIGFSQGTMTALHVLPRRDQPCAAIVGYSGAIISSPQYAGEINCKPPVCLVHGDADQVVPFAQMADAEATLSQAGIHYEAHTRPGLGHGIDPLGIKLGVEFLQNNLS